jgi:hypothetical protein
VPRKAGGQARPAGGDKERPADETDDEVLVPVELAEFPDIPVPERFDIVPRESFSATSSAYRIAHLKYLGRMSVYEVVDFYRKQMPMLGWSLEHVMGMDTKTMDFSKEDGKVRCRILIIAVGKSKSQVLIDLR